MAGTATVRRYSRAAALRRNAALLGFLIFAWMTCFSGAALVTPASAAVKFPELTGRVVDEAHILSPAAVDTLTTELKALKQETSKQLVVVTVPTLQGLSIEDYGVQLGRAWKIGQKGKNNGVLLIVAPKDRKVRIEVGYGLEGDITDAQSSQIIQDIILPGFRAGNMEQGILSGVEMIVTYLGGYNAVPKPSWENPPAQATASSTTDDDMDALVGLASVLLFAGVFIFSIVRAIFFPNSLKGVTSGYSSGSGSSAWRSSSSSSSSSDSFSGGGGSFGGGGASGSW